MSRNNRRFKRSLFKPGKWVRIIQDVDGSYAKSFMIIDISVGGIGLVSIRESEFKVGDRFYILDVDNQSPGKKIKIEVKYVRPFEGPENKFRVGCEFREITPLNFNE